MKKTFVTLALFLAAMIVVGQSAAQTAPAAATATKTIKDPAEFNAYDNAIKQTDPAAKASGLESFLTQYPSSVVKEDAMESLLGAYQQAQNGVKLAETAVKMADAFPNNVRANVVAAYFKNQAGLQKQDPDNNFASAEKYGKQGLSGVGVMAKPDGVADADFANQKKAFTDALNGIVGGAAFQLKDYPTAIQYLKLAADANPKDLQSVYQLGIAMLSSKPSDDVNGLFYVARALSLAQTPAQKKSIGDYGARRYKKFHGGDDGWDAVQTAAAANNAPPAGFVIAAAPPPPSPADQVNDFLKKDPKEWDFGLWQFALTDGSEAQKTKIWDAIKGTPIQLGGKVITVMADTLTLAASVEDIDASKPDVTLKMTEIIPAKLMPKVGDTIVFGGTFASYTASPSFMMTLDNGTLPQPKKEPAPKKPPVHHKH